MTPSPQEAPPSEPRRSKRYATALLNLTIFSAALIGNALLIGHFLPFPQVPAIATKYRYFAENREQFDTLFIGSSRVFNQIDPRLFDAEASARGAHTHSVNLAYARVWPPESFYFLRRLLELRPSRLRWVFIELMPMNVALDTRNDRTLRTAYWHDWQHTLMAWREIFSSFRDRGWKWHNGWEHTAIFLRWNLCMGRAADLLRGHLAPEKPGQPPKWVKRAGFSPVNDKQISAVELPAYLERVDKLRHERPANPMSSHYRKALEELVVEVRRAGAQPIFLITPSLGGDNFTGLPADVSVLAYNDPEKYPSLYEPKHHYDMWHLNEKGAVELTRLLAAEFAKHQEPVR